MGNEAVHNTLQEHGKNSLRSKILTINILTTSIITAVLLIFRNYMILDIAFGMLMIGGSALFAYKKSKDITEPIIAIKNRMRMMAEKCDFTSEVPEFDTNDEIGDLAASIAHLQRSLRCHMSDLQRILTSLSEYNLDLSIQCAYPGDYAIQKDALNKIITRLNEIISDLSQSTNYISKTAVQVAEGAQEISDGSTRQLNAAQQLAVQVDDVYEQTKKNAYYAEEATRLSIHAGEKMVRGTEKVEELKSAMMEMDTASKQVRDVIQTIDDISAKTRILALNASIEAARAGEAGKGFAIVAEEVRKLAAKTVEASAGTTKLIERAVSAVESGMEAAQSTAAMIDEVMEEAKKATEMTMEISKAAAVQSQSVENISNDIKMIRDVIEKNYAVAQEGAAASEEVAGQVHMLENIVDRFVLKAAM